MVRWWNVSDVSPSGLRLNRAWYIRQFLFALIPPACALMMFESVSRWEATQRGLNGTAHDQNTSSSETSKENDISKFIFENIPLEHQLKAEKLRVMIDDKLDEAQHKINAQVTHIKTYLGLDYIIDTKISPVIEAIQNACSQLDANTDNLIDKDKIICKKEIETEKHEEVNKTSSMRQRRNSNQNSEEEK